MGVIVFIIISGYYFNPSKYKTLRVFLKSKITTIIIPWMIIGTVVFLEAQLKLGKPVYIADLLKFLG